MLIKLIHQFLILLKIDEEVKALVIPMTAVRTKKT